MRKRRHGISLLYASVAMVAMCAMFSLALDFGRVTLAKTELRRSADSAARAGAVGLLTDAAEGRFQARRYAAYNTVEGSPVNLDIRNDIEFGTWDTTTRRFTKLSGLAINSSNACRIIGRRSTGRGEGIPMMFASLVGFKACNVTAESIAMITPPINVDQSVPATGNPFLAGMPSGSSASLHNPHNSPDFAGTTRDPRQSPLLVNMKISDGQILTFDSISGTARHDPNLKMFNPDGELADIGHNTNGSENGIADMTAPINALVGVFLDDKAPNLTPTPSKSLDFSTDKSRDFDHLAPQLKQVFFIGDGMNSKGLRQEFEVPKGATRLYLATWDFYEWNNNAGARDVEVIRPMRVTTVK